MNAKPILLLFLVVVVTFYGCNNDDEEPKAIATVTTATPTNVTFTTATAGGSITSNGNSAVTKSGVVYSSNVNLPTIADNKVESSVTEGTFSVNLTGLSSGTTYHTRAFATNEVGTSYGDVIDFSTGNAAPEITSITITGALEVNKTVTATYAYKDAENDPEGATVFQWYAASTSTGTDEAIIIGATQKTFLISDAQNGKFLRVAATPKATTGTAAGIEIKSAYSLAVGSETVTFMYDGTSVTYGTILSGTTQKKWLDRNLGAKHVATKIDDYEAYGDLFQWGRSTDGHQRISRTGAGNESASAATGTTTTVSATDAANTDKFIVIATGDSYDWRQPQNNNLWQGVSGTNNPCPTGWRIPTKVEWNAEGFTSGDDAFSKLKLPFTGFRDVLNGSITRSDNGLYWTSTSVEDPGYGFYSFRGQFTATQSSPIGDYSFTDRGNGEACRCIKE